MRFVRAFATYCADQGKAAFLDKVLHAPGEALNLRCDQQASFTGELGRMFDDPAADAGIGGSVQRSAGWLGARMVPLWRVEVDKLQLGESRR